ncbi:MAG: uroporphyrinogen decarboxylase family protein [Clostridia bacterium]|jgi:uroporphyrinogen decarboxylase|nr:uroporphyrinogen decarboxylase family protein [Clostridia bacterium]MDD4542666.1 uroporphyrinogen decarboxylase family protein [Clostridia bacterium]
MDLTGQERISRILKRQPVDRIGLYEHFWGDTHKVWQIPEYIEEKLGFDMIEYWAFNMVADLDYVNKTVSEDEDTITQKDGNYATLRKHKKHNATPEHIGFDIDSRAKWDELIKPLLFASDRRINFEKYRSKKQYAKEHNMFFAWSGVNAFELMHPITGHVNFLMGMIDDPEWVEDMCMTYAKLTVELQQILFEKEGYPDGIWYYEDMGFKNSPFISCDMYDRFLYPAHKYTIDYAKSCNLPVIMHSCGFVEPLIPNMLKSGIDCLQVIEVKAGMDLLRIHKNYKERLSLMGGIDVRTLYTNDKKIIDKELESKIPFVKEGFGYVLHSDHSIPNTVNFDTYQYFINRGLELGTY